MRYHFTIGYKNDFEPVFAWLQQRADSDPLLAQREEANGQYYIVAAATDELAGWAQQELNENRSLAAGLCVIEVSPSFGTLDVNLECGEEEQAVATALIKELLTEFPDYVVFDSDRDEDITELVRADVSELWGT